MKTVTIDLYNLAGDVIGALTVEDISIAEAGILPPDMPLPIRAQMELIFTAIRATLQREDVHIVGDDLDFEIAVSRAIIAADKTDTDEVRVSLTVSAQVRPVSPLLLGDNSADPAKSRPALPALDWDALFAVDPEEGGEFHA
jgi:hypothetical protein